MKRSLPRPDASASDDPGLVERWRVVMRADGVIDSVIGAPASWPGKTLAEAEGTSGALRRAAAELLREGPTSIVRSCEVPSVVEDGREVEIELFVVEALPVRRSTASLHELVMRTLDLFVSQAKSNDVDLSVDVAAEVPPSMLLDSEKFAWAIATLVANALRYAKKHVGVHVGWDADDATLVVDVSDDGAGIPESQARWLFERNPETGKAAGLALLMVRDVAAAHRGTVTVKSRARQGTTFTIRIPRPAAHPARTEVTRSG